MKVFLFGATGPTGQIILENLLKDGHQVTALARNIQKITVKHSLLTIVQGDVYQHASYQEAMSGCDIVVSALGTGKSRKPTTIYSEGGKNILTAMRNKGVKKLITITSGGVQKDDPGIQKSFFYKYFGMRLFRHIYRDMTEWENILEQSMDIDWIIVRPTYLRNSGRTGNYRIRKGFSPEKGWKISRADLADFITKQVTSDEYIHQKPTIAY